MDETKQFTLPVSKKPVIMRGYMTGYIEQEIRRVIANANKTSYEVDPQQVEAAKTSGIDPTPTVHIESDPAVAIDADNKRLELMVTALDGNTGAILERVMQLPVQDVRFILEQIAEVEGESKVEGSDPKAPTN